MNPDISDLTASEQQEVHTLIAKYRNRRSAPGPRMIPLGPEDVPPLSVVRHEAQTHWYWEVIDALKLYHEIHKTDNLMQTTMAGRALKSLTAAFEHHEIRA